MLHLMGPDARKPFTQLLAEAAEQGLSVKPLSYTADTIINMLRYEPEVTSWLALEAHSWLGVVLKNIRAASGQAATLVHGHPDTYTYTAGDTVVYLRDSGGHYTYAGVTPVDIPAADLAGVPNEHIHFVPASVR